HGNELTVVRAEHDVDRRRIRRLAPRLRVETTRLDHVPVLENARVQALEPSLEHVDDGRSECAAGLEHRLCVAHCPNSVHHRSSIEAIPSTTTRLTMALRSRGVRDTSRRAPEAPLLPSGRRYSPTEPLMTAAPACSTAPWSCRCRRSRRSS